jgi:hypothetical protein
VAGAGVVINTTVASFWIEAYEQERQIVEEIQTHFADLPEGSTILLDGGCPYVGPAPVFEASWDLRWALILRYRTYALLADVIQPTSRVESDGVSTTLYGATHTYPYSDRLHVYDSRRDMSAAMPDAEAARGYFQAADRPASECPEAVAGYGLPVF